MGGFFFVKSKLPFSFGSLKWIGESRTASTSQRDSEFSPWVCRSVHDWPYRGHRGVKMGRKSFLTPKGGVTTSKAVAWQRGQSLALYPMFALSNDTKDALGLGSPYWF